MSKNSYWWPALLAWGLAASVHAEDPAKLRSTLAVQRVERSEGQERLVPVEQARPGDVLEYRAVYRNLSDKALQHVMAVLPVPAGTVLELGSQRPQAAEASLDGEHFARYPLMRQERGTDGVLRTVPVAASRYRALRWRLAE
ncbi:MAG: hypothetical protein KGQ77_11925, partial [Betaproteobacteria bacterium]|nr:hypothetical protein [Betaproteobacteria bacterium]